MPDDADELILKMQHLAAQARAEQEARAQGGAAGRLKTRAQQLAREAQGQVAQAEEDLRRAEDKQARARVAGTPPLEAADLLVSGRAEAQDAKTRVVKARARLNFALDQMDEAERGEWNALQAEARAETHRQLAEDPLFQGAAAHNEEAALAHPEGATTGTPGTGTGTPGTGSSGAP